MIRTTIRPNQQVISFQIPQDYVGKEIEIIAFAKEEGKQRSDDIQKELTFNAISLDTRGFKFNRDEANER
ncbi:hypothetical protein [Pinibacter soli]|uniref:Uncharacterized protein n=1 Tax=Pinibacter soli TaxID=3044211 RepID=A0ABT6R763_9BACT|nr:hypothetical protein [Pinibacter soli]MDI3318286.1 hypothetical protein [Pinibacter soli]